MKEMYFYIAIFVLIFIVLIFVLIKEHIEKRKNYKIFSESFIKSYRYVLMNGFMEKYLFEYQKEFLLQIKDFEDEDVSKRLIRDINMEYLHFGYYEKLEKCLVIDQNVLVFEFANKIPKGSDLEYQGEILGGEMAKKILLGQVSDEKLEFSLAMYERCQEMLKNCYHIAHSDAVDDVARMWIKNK